VPKVYQYVDTGLVASLARQFYLPIDHETTVEFEIGMGLPKVGQAKRRRTASKTAWPPDDPRLIEAVVRGLAASGQLTDIRPEDGGYFERRRGTGFFVYERLENVTPIYLPVGEAFAWTEPPMKQLVVWVSDPITGQSDDPWTFAGSFVFLVEGHPSPTGLSSMISGISALRYVVDFLAGHSPEPISTARELSRWPERFGRFDPRHPIEKLGEVGGTMGRPRPIETVYKIAYMTDEQAHVLDGKEIRVNDILAYPLYIGAP